MSGRASAVSERAPDRVHDIRRDVPRSDARDFAAPGRAKRCARVFARIARSRNPVHAALYAQLFEVKTRRRYRAAPQAKVGITLVGVARDAGPMVELGDVVPARTGIGTRPSARCILQSRQGRRQALRGNRTTPFRRMPGTRAGCLRVARAIDAPEFRTSAPRFLNLLGAPHGASSAARRRRRGWSGRCALARQFDSQGHGIEQRGERRRDGRLDRDREAARTSAVRRKRPRRRARRGGGDGDEMLAAGVKVASTRCREYRARSARRSRRRHICSSSGRCLRPRCARWRAKGAGRRPHARRGDGDEARSCAAPAGRGIMGSQRSCGRDPDLWRTPARQHSDLGSRGAVATTGGPHGRAGAARRHPWAGGLCQTSGTWSPGGGAAGSSRVFKPIPV